MSEKNNKKNNCVYCGDAPISHAFSYVDSVMAFIAENFFDKIYNMFPRFVTSVADLILQLFFHILIFLHLITFSRDKEKANTLRSKVIWDEAERRGVEVEQVLAFGKPLDHYRARLKGKWFYFMSLPIPPLVSKYNWDDKFFLKKKLLQENIPVPKYSNVPFSKKEQKKKFDDFIKPIIVKPRSGSRGRHTTTNINTFEDFERAVAVARKISPRVVMEEHLNGYVCRATCVNGVLMGFYRAEPPSITGDGMKNILELIEEKDKSRQSRVEEIKVSPELKEYIGRVGYAMTDVLPEGKKINLTHRTGRLFGGATREMLDFLHPSFVPVLEKAAKMTKLPVAGLDCIIPNPEKDESAQHWGIIECNTLPFIDLHYFALEGEPKNIAGAIWDFWK